jgi:hypothetical protein
VFRGRATLTMFPFESKTSDPCPDTRRSLPGLWGPRSPGKNQNIQFPQVVSSTPPSGVGVRTPGPEMFTSIEVPPGARFVSRILNDPVIRNRPSLNSVPNSLLVKVSTPSLGREVGGAKPLAGVDRVCHGVIGQVPDVGERPRLDLILRDGQEVERPRPHVRPRADQLLRHHHRRLRLAVAASAVSHSNDDGHREDDGHRPEQASRAHRRSLGRLGRAARTPNASSRRFAATIRELASYLRIEERELEAGGLN